MKKALLSAGVGFALAAVSVAQSDPPKTIDVHNLPGGAKVVDDVVIPVPSEIFGVLDKLTVPPWKEVLRSQKKVATPSEREQTALLFGTVIAEGFVAVEAEDTEEVKAIGRVVQQLAKALNVDKVVTRRASSIIDNADKKNWKEVRRELDKAQHDVEQAMQNMVDSETLSKLVSLGGWLRGTEALTQVVQKTYSPDAADLLHQPSLIAYFERQLDAMPPKYKSKPLVQKMLKGLKEIRPLLGAEGTPVTEKTVKDIGKIVAELVKAISEKSNP